MSTFSDFAFYVAQGGRLSEDEYNASVRDAYTEILSQTNGTALNAPELMREPVKLCECALVDIIAGYKATADILPKGVASVTNDKLTVSAGSSSVNSASLVQAEAEERRTICARFLQWPVNLMYRGI